MLNNNFYIYGWRQVPVNPKVLGSTAEISRPEIAQVLFRKNENLETDVLERELYVMRKKIEKLGRRVSIEKFLCLFNEL